MQSMIKPTVYRRRSERSLMVVKQTLQASRCLICKICVFQSVDVENVNVVR